MKTVVLCLLWSAVWHAYATINVSLPLKLPAQKISECPVPISGHNLEVLLPRVNTALNGIYGPPSCSCAPSGTWKRIVYLDLVNTTTQCPSNWELFTNTSVRGCGRSTPTPSCDSAVFSTEGFSYNRVCGKLIAIQKGANDAFKNSLEGTTRTIEEIYMDGVSLTYGDPGSRKHIWSFVASLYENDPNYHPPSNCQCTNVNQTWPHEVPAFVGNNYFCDTPNPGPSWDDNRVYTEDPLWDGKGCGATNQCCQFNQPPWFCTSLPESSRENLELRICSDEIEAYESIVVVSAEIYVSLQ